MKLKKTVSCLLSMAMAVSMVSSLSIAGLAANTCSKPATTINDFGGQTSLTSEEYDTLANGTYSAEKINGRWYYVFKNNGNTVNVKASAFKAKAANGNTIAAANEKLTRNVLSSSGIGSEGSFVFQKKQKTTSQDVPYTPLKGSLQKNTMSTYKLFLWRADISAYRSGVNVYLQFNETGNTQFAFSDRVNSITKDGSGYHPLKTAEDYRMALVRLTNTNTAVKPEFTMEIKKPGTNRVCIYQMGYKGKGIADTNVNVASLIKIGFAAKELATSKTPMGVVKSLNSVISQSINLVPQSSEYINNKTIKLSDNDRRVFTYMTVAKSPIKLAGIGDYFLAEIALSKEPVVNNGENAELKVGIKFS